MISGIVEDLLGQESQDRHIVLADCHARMGGRYDFVDEIRPVMGPFLFQHGHQDEVELVQQGALRAKALIRVSDLDDDIHHKVSDA